MVHGSNRCERIEGWHLVHDRPEQAAVLLREIVTRYATQWPAFGYIAAEADLART
jgi:hypothetical protein